MKLSRILSSTTLCIAASTASGWVAAQQAAAPAPPPPQMENLSEVDAPAVTIKTPGEQKEKSITEKREQGRVTEVKVESANSTYYLRPKTLGSSVSGDAQSGPPTAPQWQIKEFDWGGKKASKKTVDAVDPTPGK